MTKKIKLDGSVRENLGSGHSKRLRKQGLLPCVIYDKNGNVYLSLEAKEFNKEYLKGNIQIKPIEISVGDNKKYNVLTYAVEIHPVSDLPIHVDFLNIEGKKEVKVFVPVAFKGREKSPGIKKGGFLNIIHRKIQLWCSPENIPIKISVNIGKLGMGETFKVEKVKFPEGVRPVNKKNFVIASVTGRGKSMEEEEKKKVEGAEGEVAEGEQPKEGEGGEKKTEGEKGEANNEKK